MKKAISVLALTSILTAGSAMASGFRIPEQSVDSTAKAGANVASSSRADSAYYNAANMAWMSDTLHVEMDASYIYLHPITYDDARNPAYDGESEAEHFLLPTAFMVSPSLGGARLGLAIISPFGLSKRWRDQPYPKTYSQEFSLTTIEVNPTAAYSFGKMVSVAAGARMLYADATVKSDGSGIGVPLSREMKGDTVEWGWNAAVSVKPIDKLNISATYRSHIDMEFEDKAKLNLMGTRATLDAEVSLPAPAVFALSAAYKVLDNLNVELTWDRTLWSKYESLDFNFKPYSATNPFEAPIPKDWDDGDAFRIGVTYGATKSLDLMVGFGYDKTPMPAKNATFDLPDSNAWLYSIGAQYKLNDKMDVGVAMLYDYKESLEVKYNPTDKVYGEFTDSAAILVTVGLNYRF